MTRQRFSWVIAMAIVVVRLYLTGDRDILALNSPHDEYWYIDSAFNGIWGGRYNEMTLIHLPVYSAWLALLDLLGLPARLAIDAAWLAASGYLAYAVGRLARASWAGLLLFGFLAFHPYVIRIFDRALAETLLTVLTPAVLAAAIELWRRRDEDGSTPRRIALGVYYAGFALAYYVRSEGVVLLVPLLLLGCWSLYDRRNWWLRSEGRKLPITLFALPLAATLALGCALCAANYAKWGVWATQELAAPGYKSAMAALASIDTGRTPKQVTVTREMLALAFRESPTFRELQPAMDGPVGSGWAALSAPYVAQPGEIGNGWFYWALRDVAAKTGWHADARLAEGKYAAAAAELKQAFDEGRLKRRRMFSAFVDPDIVKWAPDVPRSLAVVARLLVDPLNENIDSPVENAAPRQMDRYTVVTERRQPPPRLALAGWTSVPKGSVVGLKSPDGSISWQPLGPPRTDVPGAYAFALSGQGGSLPSTLVVRTPEGVDGVVAIATLVAGRTATLSDAGIVGIDNLQISSTPQRAGDLLVNLATLYAGIGRLSCVLIGLSIAMMIMRRRCGAIGALILLSLAAAAARTALLAVLDASSWNGAQPRYVMPAIAFFACASVLSLVYLLNEVKFMYWKPVQPKVKS